MLFVPGWEIGQIFKNFCEPSLVKSFTMSSQPMHFTRALHLACCSCKARLLCSKGVWFATFRIYKHIIADYGSIAGCTPPPRASFECAECAGGKEVWGYTTWQSLQLSKLVVEVDQRFISELAAVAVAFTELFGEAGRSKLVQVFLPLLPAELLIRHLLTISPDDLSHSIR